MEGGQTVIVEAIIIQYLSEKLKEPSSSSDTTVSEMTYSQDETILVIGESNMIPVVAETPDKEPDKFVRVERVGRQKKNFIITDSIAIQSYARSMYEAALLDEDIQQLIPLLATRSDISAVHLASSYNSTDTTKKHYRYQTIFDITHK